jgi:Lysophospholipase
MTVNFPNVVTSTLLLAERAIAFAGTVGHLHARGGEIGVVICGPWGFDGLCSRKFHRLLASRLAERGYSTLRFDYPGEGDAAAIAGGADLEAWVGGALSAAGELQHLAGCRRVIFYGMGLGGMIALLAAERFEATAGVVLAVPALNGRRFLRETGLRERVIVEDLGISLDYPEGSVSLAGFVLPQGVATALKSAVADGHNLPNEMPMLFLKRPDNASDEQVLAGLREGGREIEVADFPGYGEMMDGLNVSVEPVSPINAVVDWMTAHWPCQLSAGHAEAVEEPAVLKGDGFVETALTIGSAPGLRGVLCAPDQGRVRATLVFLNMAYTYHIGWGGQWVDASRRMAADGIRCLRVDLSNIGDSPARPGVPDQVVYAETQQRDIRTVIDWLRQDDGGPIYLVGVCSGAHAALTFAGQNRDVAGVISVNQLRLVWDPDEDVEATLRAGARPLAVYKQRAFSLDTYRRLIKGEVNLKRALQNVYGLLARRVARSLAPYLGTLTKLGRMRSTLFGMLRAMDGRGARVTFVGCRIDGSLDELARYFGPDFSGLKAFPNAALQIIEDTDHMLTRLAARRELIDVIRRTVLADAEKPDFTQT